MTYYHQENIAYVYRNFPKDMLAEIEVDDD